MTVVLGRSVHRRGRGRIAAIAEKTTSSVLLMETRSRAVAEGELDGFHETVMGPPRSSAEPNQNTVRMVVVPEESQW